MMKRTILLACTMFSGCLAPRHTGHVLEERPPDYFAELPDVPIPTSPYSDPEQTRWFKVGYREGYQAGQGGIAADGFPRYPQHPACLDNRLLWSAQTNGFEKGYGVSFAAAQDALCRELEEVQEKSDANN